MGLIMEAENTHKAALHKEMALLKLQRESEQKAFNELTQRHMRSLQISSKDTQTDPDVLFGPLVGPKDFGNSTNRSARRQSRLSLPACSLMNPELETMAQRQLIELQARLTAPASCDGFNNSNLFI
jgi:hypothetical protein